MSYELKMVTCGTCENFENIELCSPISNQILFDPKNIKSYIAKHSKSVFFIVVLLNLFGQTIDSLLTEIGNNENIIGIFICANQIYNLASNQTNVFHLSNRLLTCKTTSCAIRSYESAARRLHKTNYKGLAHMLDETSRNLRQWLSTSNKVKACDVLIIPLNTTNENLYDFQQRVIDLCRNICSDYKPTVCTLYDYILSDELDPNVSDEERAFVNKQNEIICTLLQKLACIRIYLVENKDCISNNWSKLMIENEPDNGGQNELKYDERCTFVENEPATNESIHNLFHRYNSSWRVTNIMPIRLDTIQNDIYFPTALDRSHTTLEAREMVANTDLFLWAMNYHENSIEHSDKFCTTGQAVDGLMEQDDNITEMDERIQLDYRTDFSNQNHNT